MKVIKTEQEYDLALARLEQIFDAPAESPDGDEAEVLVILIEHYEDRYHPIEAPDPIEAIKTRMEDLGYQQKDLVGIIGGKSRVSEILNKKKRLTLEMVRRLTKILGISPNILIQDYPLHSR